MADLNGAGSTTLGGLSGTAAGQTRYWGPVTPTGPDNGNAVPAVTETLTMTCESWNGTADVRVQVSTVADFASTISDDVLLSQTADGSTVINDPLTGLVDGTTYYWRAAAGEPGAGTFGAWSDVWSFRVFVNTGDAVEYVTCNVGVEITPSPDATEYVETNVGVLTHVDPDAVEYVFCNVGVLLHSSGDGVEYAYENVTTTTPTPAIWFLKPTSGRSGDGINVVGWGFGDLQTTYSGIVEVDFGDGLGWTAVPAVSWQTFPATADAYDDERELDPVFGEVDWQHTVIGILVPSGAVPPGYPVRVRTNGP